MVNLGLFRGLRKEFLMSKKSEYKAAVQGGFAADALVNIQQEYLKWYPIDLPHDQEPVPEVLAVVDNDLPDSDVEAPDPLTMGEQEYAAALEALETQRNLLTFWKSVRL